jgi:hypothetical protein
MKDFEYLLQGKFFVFQSDHNNLKWMEASLVPKIIRWRIFMQSFNFLIEHIPGSYNREADYLSRQWLGVIDEDTVLRVSPEDILRQVHGDVLGHFGARYTWILLGKHFPGHRISMEYVREYVATCPICQKIRLGMVDNLPAVVRFLKPVHARAIVGADTLTITPKDKFGHELCVVVVNHFTKLTGIYPVESHEAIHVARALFLYFCTYGLVDAIQTDPGTEFTAEVIAHLNGWLGVKHNFSLVNRHESNGVERTNREILRHISTLVHDQRVVDRWSDPVIIGIVTHLINSTPSSETGFAPYELHFGSNDLKYCKDLGYEQVDEDMNTYVKALSEDISLLRETSFKHQQTVAETRMDAKVQQLYQPGDFILKQYDRSQPKPSKLTPRFSGPYMVLNQYKNDIECKHICQGSIHKFHVSEVKIFHGSKEQALEMAKLDFDQYVVKKILAYRGDPDTRTTMEFYVHFEDDSKVWIPYNKDLDASVQFEDYCRSRPELSLLLYSASEAKRRKAEINRKPITEVDHGDIVFVDLRCYGSSWYSNLNFPDADFKNYVVLYEYGKWKDKSRRRISCYCKAFNEVFVVDHHFVLAYGSKKVFNHSTDILIDSQFVKDHPQVLDTNVN